ncbi:MAG: Asp-tRNA(Asn)/Glu-tRNA(Gln) amidotransferase subunit GatC [Patescibacteria group bacterium]
MAITKEEIKHIAELARLDLSAEEQEKFGAQLDLILGYVKQLDEVNTKGVEITSQVSGLVDVWREDEAKDWPRDEVERALSQGDLEGGQVKVKKVL